LKSDEEKPASWKSLQLLYEKKISTGLPGAKLVVRVLKRRNSESAVPRSDLREVARVDLPATKVIAGKSAVKFGD